MQTFKMTIILCVFLLLTFFCGGRILLFLNLIQFVLAIRDDFYFPWPFIRIERRGSPACACAGSRRVRCGRGAPPPPPSAKKIIYVRDFSFPFSGILFQFLIIFYFSLLLIFFLFIIFIFLCFLALFQKSRNLVELNGVRELCVRAQPDQATGTAAVALTTRRPNLENSSNVFFCLIQF